MRLGERPIQIVVVVEAMVIVGAEIVAESTVEELRYFQLCAIYV